MAALAVGIAALAAVLSYRLLEGWSGAVWLPAGLRAAAWGAVALLVLNVSCPAIRPPGRPIVLLDASLSMQAAGGHWGEALALARRTGEVRLVGALPGDTVPGAGRTRLAAAIAGARSAGRPVMVVTDGEVEDAGEIPADVLAGTTVRVLPRTDTSDVALTRVEGTTRLTLADSLRIEVEATATGGGARRLPIEVMEGQTTWLRGAIDLDAAGAGRTRLAAAIAGARSTGRPVTVVTDGEVEDAGEIPADVLAGTTVRVLPRSDTVDVALTRVEGTTRLTLADSLRIEVEATATGGPRRLPVEAMEGQTVWLRGTIDLDAAGRGRTVLTGPLPRVPPGPHVLTIRLAQAADAEPRDDARLLVVSVVRTPGIVLLASPPGWESRFLLDALRDVSALPARGYVETERGRWRRSGDLHPVPTGEVADAARRADLLVVLGAPGEVGRGSRARGVWTWLTPEDHPGADGDWYLSLGTGGPLMGALSGLAVDSFPPGTAVADLAAGPSDWVGLTAQAGRRGTPRPVLLGRDSAGVRRLITGIDGLWRWAFHGGSSEQGYRSLVAESVSWLLGGADSVTGRARPLRDVVQRGRPAVFEWSGGGASVPLPVAFDGTGGVRNDTLVFDGAGHAEVLLPPGIWRYKLAGGGEGTLAVEEYSDEWVPGARTLTSRAAATAPESTRVPLRGWLPLFGIAVAAFAGEWLARRRMGLR
jgi:hypothetical protein